MAPLLIPENLEDPSSAAPVELRSARGEGSVHYDGQHAEASAARGPVALFAGWITLMELVQDESSAL